MWIVNNIVWDNLFAHKSVDRNLVACWYIQCHDTCNSYDWEPLVESCYCNYIILYYIFETKNQHSQRQNEPAIFFFFETEDKLNQCQNEFKPRKRALTEGRRNPSNVEK